MYEENVYEAFYISDANSGLDNGYRVNLPVNALADKDKKVEKSEFTLIVVCNNVANLAKYRL
jgi:hypothetical protein